MNTENEYCIRHKSEISASNQVPLLPYSGSSTLLFCGSAGLRRRQMQNIQRNIEQGRPRIRFVDFPDIYRYTVHIRPAGLTVYVSDRRFKLNCDHPAEQTNSSVDGEHVCCWMCKNDIGQDELRCGNCFLCWNCVLQLQVSLARDRLQIEIA